MTAKRESGLRSRIAAALRKRGAVVAVMHGGLFSTVGVSDLLVCYRGRFLALEIKTITGRVTDKQVKFLEDVNRAGGVGLVVRSVKEAEALMTQLDDLMADLGLSDDEATSPNGSAVVEDDEDNDEDSADEATEVAVDTVAASGDEMIESLLGDLTTGASQPQAARPKRGSKPRPVEPATEDDGLVLAGGSIQVGPLTEQIAALDAKFDRVMEIISTLLEQTAAVLNAARESAAGADAPASSAPGGKRTRR